MNLSYTLINHPLLCAPYKTFWPKIFDYVEFLPHREKRLINPMCHKLMQQVQLLSNHFCNVYLPKVALYRRHCAYPVT